jgi:hypothetical protein
MKQQFNHKLIKIITGYYISRRLKGGGQRTSRLTFYKYLTFHFTQAECTGIWDTKTDIEHIA